MQSRYIFCVLLLLSNSIWAMNVDTEHPIQAQISVTKPKIAKVQGSAFVSPITKEVTILKLNLTPEERSLLEKKIKAFPQYKRDLLAKKIAVKKNYDNLSVRASVDMSSIPVFNQGHHGTCVTFAITTALDSLFDKGDWISQECSLQLGNYLNRLGYGPSGWNGSKGDIVLGLISNFGVVDKAAEKSGACNQVTEYPAEDANNMKQELSLEDHKKISQDLSSFKWRSLFDFEQLVSMPEDFFESKERLLNQVKYLLSSQRAGVSHRLTLGTVVAILDNQECGGIGICGKHHMAGDTWIMFPGFLDSDGSSTYKIHLIGLHEMMITGYDDEAEAVDQYGNVHKGLLTLRNSWGEEVGDNGNFYMSYDYFKMLSTNVENVTLNNDNR